MQLPALTLPKIDLPFDIPVLLHPPVDHFAIALPVVILLLEFYNLFARKKSIGAFSFLLLILTVGAFAIAYLTGTTDGKEAYDLLTPEGQDAFNAHKLLGTYLLLGTVVVLFFKLLAMTGKTYFKFFFFVVLIGLIVGTFEQGEHGGELVYKYGANVERVKTLDDELFDAKEALEEAEEAVSKVEKTVSTVKKSETTVLVPQSTTTVVEDNKTVKSKSANETVETLLDTATKEMKEANKEVIETLKDAAKDVEKKTLEKLPVDNEIH